MTLDEMLALLPDNTTGAIGADDLRAIVTGLFDHAWVANAHGYEWTNNSTGLPASNKVNMAWVSGAQVLHVSQQDGGGVVTPLTALSKVGTHVRLEANDGGAILTGLVSAAATDNGNWRDIFVNVQTVVGTVPSSNTLMTLTLLTEVVL